MTAMALLVLFAGIQGPQGPSHPPTAVVEIDDRRDAGGTAWQPGSTPHSGVMFGYRGWSFMVHGQADVVYVNESSPRGGEGFHPTNMVALRAGRRLGPGILAASIMGTAEPLMGATGYPLLLQTGETADGLNPLIDRQHPHDALMELSLSYRTRISSDAVMYLYVAPVGAPALGPPAFMHRLSAQTPNAPLSHHFLDATHISHGVATLGLIAQNHLKVEVSYFNGREPDQRRWNIDAIRFDSYALRITANLSETFSLEGSVGGRPSPERLHPGIGDVSLTTSATYNRPLARGNWQTMLAYGRRKSQQLIIPVTQARLTFPKPILDHYLSLASATGLPEDSLLLFFPTRVQRAIMLESALQWGRATWFMRVEMASKDELFPPADLRHSQIFTVGKVEAGLAHDFLSTRHFFAGLGVAASLYVVPSALRGAYGTMPRSVQLFSRFRLGS